jgi:Bacterial dnaA protein helix-turn-helix
MSQLVSVKHLTTADAVRAAALDAYCRRMSSTKAKLSPQPAQITYQAPAVPYAGFEPDGRTPQYWKPKTLKNVEPKLVQQDWHIYHFIMRGRRIDGEADGNRITVNYIVFKVAEYYGLSVNDIKSARRTRRVVLPRQICMYIAQQMTIQSLPQIGRMIGNRDHTTALHGIRKVTGMIEKDATFAAHVKSIMETIK